MRGKTFEKVFPRTPFQNFSGQGIKVKPFVWFAYGSCYFNIVGVDGLAAARSRHGSDNRTGLSFTTVSPLRYLPYRQKINAYPL